MDKSKMKIKLELFRLVLVFVFFILSGLTLLYSISVSSNLFFFSSLTLLLLSLNLLLFIVGNLLKKGLILFVSWILLAFLNIEAYILFFSGVTYLFSFFWMMVLLIFVDLAHFSENILPISVCLGNITDEQSKRIWSLIKRHLFFVITFSALSYLLSFTIISISFPIQLFFNPVLGIAIFCSIAILLIAGLVLER